MLGEKRTKPALAIRRGLRYIRVQWNGIQVAHPIQEKLESFGRQGLSEQEVQQGRALGEEGLQELANQLAALWDTVPNTGRTRAPARAAAAPAVAAPAPAPAKHRPRRRTDEGRWERAREGGREGGRRSTSHLHIHPWRALVMAHTRTANQHKTGTLKHQKGPHQHSSSGSTHNIQHTRAR